jgi:hypothetical protein
LLYNTHVGLAHQLLRFPLGDLTLQNSYIYSVSWILSTGSYIDEQSVTMLNLLYNLINLVLTEDQSDRPISDLEVKMSEATNMRVVSCAQDFIYDVTRCKLQTPERVGLAVLLKNLTGSAELVKVRQTLCRVGGLF